MTMRVLPGVVVPAVVACSLLATPAAAAAAESGSRSRVSVVELFTSHGCSSCPPADALLGELVDSRDDVIALEWHVDYWDTLVHGSDGSWTDPFSNPAYSARQRAYNRQPLRGRPGVYTPQMVVNGRFAAVGSDAARVSDALAGPLVPDVDVTVAQQGETLSISLAPADATGQTVEPGDGTAADGRVPGTVLPQADVWLVHYRDSATTTITAGENRDLELTNHHVVTGMQRVGSTDDDVLDWEIGYRAREGHGCAVLVQGEALSPIRGAGRCP